MGCRLFHPRGQGRAEVQGLHPAADIRQAAAVVETIEPTVFVAVVDLVAGHSGDTELTAQWRHLLAVQEAGDESETLFHDMTLLPGHDDSLPQKEKVLPMCPEWSVTYVSVRTQ